MEIAKLHAAFVWECSSCGEENFCKSEPADLDEEESRELKEEYGISEFELGEWVTLPDLVECRLCNKVYKTVDPLEDNEDQENIEEDYWPW